MAPESDGEPIDRPCKVQITGSGLLHRTDALLERERNLYPLMADRLAGRGKGEFAEPAAVTMGMIEEAFTARSDFGLRAAAFLAGRCDPGDAKAREKLTKLLRDFITSLEPHDRGPLEVEYIEAAMSLALRGDPEAARTALAAVIPEGHSGSGYAYLAAFYLAQLGDASGYPVVLRALHSENEHTRLMAVRHLLAFQPYNGQEVKGRVVDTRRELIARLSDHEPYVRVEVPYYLSEAGVTGLVELLEPLVLSDPDEGVREAAAEVLRRHRVS